MCQPVADGQRSVDVGGDGSAKRPGQLGRPSVADAGRGRRRRGHRRRVWPPCPAPPSARYSPQPERVAALDPFAGTYTQPTPPTSTPWTTLRAGPASHPDDTVVYRRVTVTGACSVGKRPAVRHPAIADQLRRDVDRLRHDRVPDLQARSSGARLRRRRKFNGGSIDLRAAADHAVRRVDQRAGRPLAVLYDRANTGAMTVNGELRTSAGSVYGPPAALPRLGRPVIHRGRDPVGRRMDGEQVRVDPRRSRRGGGRARSRPGAYRLALVK